MGGWYASSRGLSTFDGTGRSWFISASAVSAASRRSCTRWAHCSGDSSGGSFLLFASWYSRRGVLLFSQCLTQRFGRVHVEILRLMSLPG